VLDIFSHGRNIFRTTAFALSFSVRVDKQIYTKRKPGANEAFTI